MFCTKCGNEMKEGQLFCTKCGAKSVNVQNEKKTDSFNFANTLNNNTCISNADKILGMYMISIGLILLGGIMILTKTFQIESFGMVQRANIFELIDEKNASLIRFIAIAIYAVTAVFMLIPAIAKRKIKKYNAIIPLITVIVTILLFIAVISIGNNEVDEWGADFGLSTNGIIGMICSAANAIILLRILITSRKNS